jgi:hypothetical protein
MKVNILATNTIAAGIAGIAKYSSTIIHLPEFLNHSVFM